MSITRLQQTLVIIVGTTTKPHALTVIPGVRLPMILWWAASHVQTLYREHQGRHRSRSRRVCCHTQRAHRLAVDGDAWRHEGHRPGGDHDVPGRHSAPHIYTPCNAV